jgi:hypothetical protein
MEKKSLIPPGWHVPETFRRRLGNRYGRQRLMAAEGHLLLVLHLPPSPGETERAGRLIWREPDGTWHSSDLGSGPQVIARHLDQYAEVIQTCDEREQHASGVEDYFAVMEMLGPVLRSARHLHQVLQEARTAVPDDRDLINFRDRAYEVERNGELLCAQTQHSLDFALARRAQEQAQSSRQMAVSAHRLNLLAAFFFPLATLGAVFSMTFRHGWEETPPPLPLLVTVAVGLAAGLLLTAFVRTHRG